MLELKTFKINWGKIKVLRPDIVVVGLFEIYVFMA